MYANDSLPDNVCSKCCEQLESFKSFLNQAKTSDGYLQRIANKTCAIVKSEPGVVVVKKEEDADNLKKSETNVKNKKRSRVKSKSMQLPKKLKSSVAVKKEEKGKEDEIYMIIVEREGQANEKEENENVNDEDSIEIVKMESHEAVDVEEADVTETTMVADNVTLDDHSYTKLNSQDDQDLIVQSEIESRRDNLCFDTVYIREVIDEFENEDVKDIASENSDQESKFDFENGYALADDPDHCIFRVMLESTICEECDEECYTLRSLTRHYLDIHNIVLVLADSLLLTCPLCKCRWKISEKQLFIEHLCTYRSLGYHFIKVNKYGKVIKASKSEAEAFTPFSIIRDIIIGRDLSDIELEDIRTRDFSDTELSSDSEMPFVDRSNFDFLTEDPKKHKSSKLKKPEEKKKGNALVNHLKTTFYCNLCGKGCGGKANLNRHLATHNKPDEKSSSAVQKFLECSICRKVFNSKMNLKEHLVQHNDEILGAVTTQKPLNFMCSICGEKFPSKLKLLMHKVSHRSNKKNPYKKCDICERMFLKKSTFERHVAAHSNPNYFSCHICKLPLPSSKRLKHHLRTHHFSEGAVTYDCDICNISFLSEVSLVDHKAQTGHDVVSIECKDCEEHFENAKEYGNHVKLHPKFNICECGLCGKQFANAYFLTKHVDRHLQSCEFLCPECGCRFGDQNQFTSHIHSHKVKPFPCNEPGCNNLFSTSTELNRHKKSHVKDGSCVCEFCNERFFESSHLVAHLKIHIGEYHFCPHCTEHFSTIGECKDHVISEHEGMGIDDIVTKKANEVHTEEFSD